MIIIHYLGAMNYLAHIYLSGKDDELKIGNFIADSIKGNKYSEFCEGIKNGIFLHRKIDTFTDAHPVVRKSTARLMPKFGLYSGVIVDMLYDHFLAANWKDYHPQDLNGYVAEFYDLLHRNRLILPKRVQRFLPHMVEHNWLVSYASIHGMEKILFQMNQRVKNDVQLHLAIQDLEQHYSEFEEEFREFFQLLIDYVREERIKLENEK